MNVLKKWRNYSLGLLSLALILSGSLLSLGEKPITPQVASSSIEEKRFNVQKDFYRAQSEGERLHSRISCPKSTLKTIPSTHHFIEEMEEVEAVLQHKFEGDDQEIRTFSSDKGTYNYASHTFQANSVLLYFYREPGHLFPSHLDPNTAFLHGLAEEVTLLIDKSPDFKAEKFKANIKIEPILYRNPLPSGSGKVRPRSIQKSLTGEEPSDLQAEVLQ